MGVGAELLLLLPPPLLLVVLPSVECRETVEMAESMDEVRGGGRFANCDGGIGDVAVAAVDNRTSGTERCCCWGLPLLLVMAELFERDFGTEG